MATRTTWCELTPCQHEQNVKLIHRKSPLKVVVDYSTSTRCTVPGEVISRQGSISCCPVCVGESLGLFSYPAVTSDDFHICINSIIQTPVPFRRRPEDENTAFLYCPARVWAFSLRFRTWELVSHDHLERVLRDGSFETELFMDKGRKETLNDIVSAYMDADGKFMGNDEALGRKGRGLNVLLEGSPGTGKTLTAGKYLPPLDHNLKLDFLTIGRMYFKKVRSSAIYSLLWRSWPPARRVGPETAGNLHSCGELECHGPTG